MKKLFALIVAICATTLAWADDSGSCGENVTYSFVESTGTLTISGTGDMNFFDDSPWNAYSSSIKKVVINNGVTSIGREAFSGCTGLTSVTIGNDVTSIGYQAFSGCTGLTSVTIPNSVTSIGYSAFFDCTGLTSVTIGNGVTSIADVAFYGCTGLTSITIPNSVTSIGYAAFNGVKHITYTGGATGSPWGAVAVNGFVDGDFVFSDDKKTQLAAYVGNGGSVIIPDGVTSIGEWAFMECTLTSITIGNGVTSIGEMAFYDCTGLTSMTVEATPPPYSSNIVSNYNIPLYVPEESVDAYKAADEWKKFTNIQAIPATGVNEAAAEKSEVKKIIDRNGIIYIEKDGTRYFLNGGKVE